MKTLITLLIFFALSPIRSSAQRMDSLLGVMPIKSGKVSYVEVINASNVDKAELYLRAKTWLAYAYKSPKDVTQLEDVENCDLVLKSNFKTQWQTSIIRTTESIVDYTVHISVKDGKYRYEITDFVVHGYTPPSTNYFGGKWEYSIEDLPDQHLANTKKYLVQQLVPNVLALIGSLKTGMAQNTDPKDW